MAYAAEHVFSEWCTERAYQRWVACEKFYMGDTLVLKYEKQYRVERVTREDYERCNSGAALYSYDGGETAFSLAHPGMGYFVCPGSGLFDRGMKLEINVKPSNSSLQSSEATYYPQGLCGFCILCC